MKLRLFSQSMRFIKATQPQFYIQTFVVKSLFKKFSAIATHPRHSTSKPGVNTRLKKLLKTVAHTVYFLPILTASPALAGTAVSSTPALSYQGPSIGYKVHALSLSTALSNQTTCTKTASRNFTVNNIPAGATVREATLYWATDNGNDLQVTLAGTTVNASTSWTDLLSFSGSSMTFGGQRANVTSIVQANGTYAFSGLTSRNTVPFAGGCLAGAVLIVVYNTPLSDPNALNRIEILDGFQGIRGAGGTTGGTASTITLPTSLQGVPLTFTTSMSWQGNSLSEGAYIDTLTANALTISDGNNPSNDQSNGSGANSTPNSIYAVDADTFDISNLVKGAPSLTLTNSSAQSDYVISQGFIFGARGPDVSDGPSSYGIAKHEIQPNLNSPSVKLGTLVDGEVVNNTYAGSLNADFDDTNYLNNDDEDGVVNFAPLNTLTSSYSVNVKLTNISGNPANLAGWIDFNRNGTFDNTEVATATISNNTTNGTVTLTWTNVNSKITNGAGATFARFRISTDSISSATSVLSNGEVEDYQLTIATSPNLVLVKRITAINSTPITTVVDDPGDLNDTNPNWPSGALKGAIAGSVQPQQEAEYTIYFLSTGSSDAVNSRICDLVPANTVFVVNAFSSGKGIRRTFGTTTTDFTNLNDADQGRFYTSTETAPTVCRVGSNVNGTVLTNVNGAVVVDLGTIPKAVGSGDPANSYGYVRFRVKVN